MSGWRLAGDATSGLRLETTRGFGHDQFTWEDLLYSQLTDVRLYVLYFPSRFDLPADEHCMHLLRTFGDNTSTATSVNFWDPRDQQCGDALALFGVPSPPALVLVNGLQLTSVHDAKLYSISFIDKDVLTDTDSFVAAVNLAHEVVSKGDPKEIARLIQKRDHEALYEVIGRVGAAARDHLVRLKPKLGLPGGISIGLGGS